MAFQPTFTSTGVDLFGPLSVKSRSPADNKKGVCLFTCLQCLATRAVHLDICASLDADDFYCLLRQFYPWPRRPKELRSDRGINLVGAKRLMDEIQNLHIKWVFNPRASPHMGGIWERMVKSVKTYLLKVLQGQVVSEYALRTALAEIEHVLN